MNTNLKGMMSLTDFYDLTEKIAQLIDANLNTSVEDLSNINNLIIKEIEVAYHSQRIENIEVNGGSK